MKQILITGCDHSRTKTYKAYLITLAILFYSHHSTIKRKTLNQNKSKSQEMLFSNEKRTHS